MSSSRTLRHGRDGAGATVIEANSDRPLLEILRSELGVRSASRGCRDGSCGACRVLLDGALVSSCRVAWSEVRDGARVEAYEDLEFDSAAVRAVEAFSEERPTRCRMCVGALGVTAVAIARATPEGLPKEDARTDAIDAALVDATCLCTGRGSWRRALSK